MTCSMSRKRNVTTSRKKQRRSMLNDAPAAFPTIGRRMRPTNPLLMWPLEVRPLMESTRNSAVTATSYSARLEFGTVKKMGHRQTTVTTIRSTIVVRRSISGSSLSSPFFEPASNECAFCSGESITPVGGGELEVGSVFRSVRWSFLATFFGYSTV